MMELQLSNNQSKAIWQFCAETFQIIAEIRVSKISSLSLSFRLKPTMAQASETQTADCLIRKWSSGRCASHSVNDMNQELQGGGQYFLNQILGTKKCVQAMPHQLARLWYTRSHQHTCGAFSLCLLLRYCLIGIINKGSHSCYIG